MKLASCVVLAGSLLVTMTNAMGAQVRTIPEETVTATVTIEAIEQSTRLLSVRREDGTPDMLLVPPDFKRFSDLKVGDKITARYYGSLIVRLKKPGEPAIDVDNTALTPTTGAGPGGTVGRQRTLTVTITAIDPKVPSITVKSANGWVYSRKINDKAALAKVKVGDRLDITWNDAVLISAAPTK